MTVTDEDGVHSLDRGAARFAQIIKTVGERSPHGQGNFNFAAIAMLKPYGPFYPGAWHPGGGPPSFAIGLEAANVVMDVFAREHDPRTAGKVLTDALTLHAHAVEAAALKAAAGSGWTYAGIDPTPAPGGQVSIGTAIESFTGAPFGSPGTETAAGIITRAVQAVPVKQTGYSGLMIPVLEDTVLTRRWTEGTYGLDSILAYWPFARAAWTRYLSRETRAKSPLQESSAISLRWRPSGTSRWRFGCCRRRAGRSAR